MDEFFLRPFESADQTIAKQLVLEGLGSRFGHIDYSMNPDLDDIQAAYIERGHRFYVLILEDAIIGTCALTNESPSVGRIERMSVQADQQGKGLARYMTNFLIQTARDVGMTRMVVETNDSWESALRLYKTSGFVETHREGVEVHMAMDLT